QARVNRNERSGERAFAEQILEQVRNAERGVERVGGQRLLAEVMREDPCPHQAGEAADENAGRDHRIGRGEAPARGRRVSGHSPPAVAAESPGPCWPPARRTTPSRSRSV